MTQKTDRNSMTNRAPEGRHSDQVRAPWWAALALAVGVATTLGLWSGAHGAARRALARETEVVSRQASERIRECVRTRVEMIGQVGREWELGGISDDGTFVVRVEALFETFPGYLAVNRIDEGVIAFVYPFGPNRFALGRQIAETPPAAATLAEALADGALRVSPPVELFQAGVGFAVYVPVNTADGMTRVLNGVFRADALVRACLGSDDLSGHTLVLEDANATLFERREVQDDARFAASTAFPLFNRTWTLRLAPGIAHVTAAFAPTQAILVTGLPLSAIVGVVLFWLLRTRNRSRARDRIVAAEREAERRSVEEKLQQVDRMEALGHLGAAVAHDFNNLLTIIMASGGHIDQISDSTEIKGAAKDIIDAAHRGSALASELVTFGRGDPSPPQNLDLGAW